MPCWSSGYGCIVFWAGKIRPNSSQCITISIALRFIPTRILHLRRCYADNYNILKFQPAFLFSAAYHSGTFEILSETCGRARLKHGVSIGEAKQMEGIPMSREIAYCLLQQCIDCKDLECGRRVQFLMAHAGLDYISALGDHLIRLFVHHGRLAEANRAFNKIEEPSTYTLAAITLGNADLGQGEVALELYHKMQLLKRKDNSHTYVAALKACIITVSLAEAKIIHVQVIKDNHKSVIVLENTLINMYAKCERLQEALAVFDQLPNRDVVSWNAMIDGFLKHGDLLSAEKYFEEMQKAGIKPSLISWSSMISGYVQHGESESALSCFEKMQLEGIKPNEVTILSMLKACGISQLLEEGRLLHEHILQTSYQTHVAITNTLVDMYVKCGSLMEAHKVFDNLANRNVVSWNAMIAGYARHGNYAIASDFLKRMEQEGIIPDVVSWNSMITGCTLHDTGLLALQCFEKMQNDGIESNAVTFLSTLKACSTIGAIEKGKFIHATLIKKGYELELMVGSSLVDMYAKCGCLTEAHNVFHKLSHRNIVTWNAILFGYAQYSSGVSALQLIQRMRQDGIFPDSVSFLFLLKTCSRSKVLEHGRLLHEQILQSELQSDAVLGSAIVDMYAKLGQLNEAHMFFDKLKWKDIISWNIMISGYVLNGENGMASICFEKMQLEGIKPNVVSWNAIVAGYAQQDKGLLAVECFQKMQEEGIDPDEASFMSILKAVSNITAFVHGRLINEMIIEKGVHSDLICNALVDMYAKCGSFEEASSLFYSLPDQNMVRWNAMISGYAEHGEGRVALECFEEMQQGGVEPNEVTFLNILKACISIGTIEESRLIHEMVIEKGLEQNILVGSMLVDLYSKCHNLEAAHRALTTLSSQDVVSFGAMIAGYSQHGEGCLALQCFEKMQQDGIKPNEIVFSSVLKACASRGIIERGRFIHAQIIEVGFHLDIIVGNTLVDMYAKCGNLEEACKVFDHLPSHNVVSWGAMVAGYSQHGDSLLSLDCFEKMQKEKIKPDATLFTSILVACTRAGLADEGRVYFKSMKEYHRITPTVSHYTCMIDLLGRAGCLTEAETIILGLPQIDVVG